MKRRGELLKVFVRRRKQFSITLHSCWLRSTFLRSGKRHDGKKDRVIFLVWVPRLGTLMLRTISPSMISRICFPIFLLFSENTILREEVHQRLKIPLKGSIYMGNFACVYSQTTFQFSLSNRHLSSRLDQGNYDLRPSSFLWKGNPMLQ